MNRKARIGVAPAALSGVVIAVSPYRLTWKNVSTLNLRDFVGYDGEQGVARIYKAEHAPDWRWSVYAIVPARPGLTHGHEADPKEARRTVEAAWAIAKANGVWTPTATTRHLHVQRWPCNGEGGP